MRHRGLSSQQETSMPSLHFTRVAAHAHLKGSSVVTALVGANRKLPNSSRRWETSAGGRFSTAPCCTPLSCPNSHPTRFQYCPYQCRYQCRFNAGSMTVLSRFCSLLLFPLSCFPSSPTRLADAKPVCRQKWIQFSTVIYFSRSLVRIK